MERTGAGLVEQAVQPWQWACLEQTVATGKVRFAGRLP
jgi:hypothetical protein